MAGTAVSGAGAEWKSLKLCAAHGGRPRLLLAEDCDPVRIVTAVWLGDVRLIDNLLVSV